MVPALGLLSTVSLDSRLITCFDCNDNLQVVERWLAFSDFVYKVLLDWIDIQCLA